MLTVLLRSLLQILTENNKKPIQISSQFSLTNFFDYLYKKNDKTYSYTMLIFIPSIVVTESVQSIIGYSEIALSKIFHL